MSTRPNLRIGHVAIFVRDIDKMRAFYTDILGFTVTDEGPHPVASIQMIFMSSNPKEHHEFVLLEGRPENENYSPAQQLSFYLGNLDELRALRDRLVAEGIEIDRYACHGNALSFYFPDPDGNYLEMYIHTPWYIPQPHGVPYDLSLPNEEIMRQVEAHCREDPGFMMEADRQKQARETMPG